MWFIISDKYSKNTKSTNKSIILILSQIEKRKKDNAVEYLTAAVPLGLDLT